ncbi:MAG: hypothetical protein ACE5GQ_03620, partial [Nitrospinales bacterium]
MFQRCYFAGMGRVDFSNVYFRHTTFEGGEIELLKKWDGNLKSALTSIFKDEYGELPKIAAKRIDELCKIP